MHNNDSDHPDTISEPDGKRLPGFNPDNAGDSTPQEQRREPVFSGFDEEDNYEEPDRDTDSASSYREENLEDEEFDELPQDAGDFTPQAEIEWDELERDDNWEEPDQELEVEPEQTSRHYALTSEGEEEEEQNYDDWGDEEGYFEEDDGDFQKLPLGLIVVAIVALLLLAAGGYGVIQQRSATQEKIRELQATLATAASPAEVAASRGAMREVRERNTKLLASVDTLTLENRRRADTVAGLKSQLAAQQAALDKQAAAPPPAAPKPATPQPVAAPAPVKATPKSATPESAAPIAAGGGVWFVNFSSYNQRTTAESRATKLKPGAGKVVVTTGNKGGATVYRVRVVGLTSRESAEKIARQLESEYGLPKLWVGRQ